ncbi:uncharacterized protein [Typha angustifolia]|uniref:uncharacterized protein n=1 Tax=Typha angustifolia TaxID=59011 RepID=UPI003C2E756C
MSSSSGMWTLEFAVRREYCNAYRFCLDLIRDTLLRIAKHYKAGESLPEEVYLKLLAAKTFRYGSLSLRQVGMLPDTTATRSSMRSTNNCLIILSNNNIGLLV